MIEILDKDFKKIDALRRYVFAQYNLKSREIGTFEIQLKPDDKATRYLFDETKTYYVLFDSEVLGKLEKVKKDSEIEGNKNIILTGRLCEYIFAKRVIFGTIKFKGKSYKLIEELVNKNIVEQINTPRYIPIEVVYEDEQALNDKCSDIERQITGGYLWDEIQKVLEQDKLSVRIIPVVQPEHDYNGTITNISKWQLYVSTGRDLTQGDDAVIFSQILSNVTNTNYERDTGNNCNVAYVAGEGEEADRKWYEVYETDGENKQGWEREELWVDARDIQSESANDTTLTPEEYAEKINIRGQEKLSENVTSVIYGATATKKNIQEQYGKKYKLGDWVVARDTDIGMQIEAQITGYIKSWDGTGIVQDLELTYGTMKKDVIERSKMLSQQVNVSETNIQYILNNMGKTGGGTPSVGETKSDYVEYRNSTYNFSVPSASNTTIKEFTVSNGIYRIEAFVGFQISSSAMTALYIQSDSTGVMTSECYVRNTMGSGGGMSASCFVDARGKSCTVKVLTYQEHTAAVNIVYNIQAYKEISTGIESGATYQELALYNYANANDKISPYGKQYIVYNSEMAFIHFHFNSGNNVSKANKVIAELPVKVQDVSNIYVDTEPSTYNRNKYVVRVNNNYQLCFGSDVPSNTHMSINLILKRFGVSDAPKELPVDYIIEEGYDGAAGWWYRKYNSGYIDMWYKRSIGTLSLTTKFVEGIYSNASWNSVPLSYPFELSDVEHAESNIFSNGYTLSQVSTVTVNQVEYRIWSPYSSTPTNCVLSIYLRGKLK